MRDAYSIPMRLARLLMWVLGAGATLSVTGAAAQTAPTTPKTVGCPIATRAIVGPVQWSFSDPAPPNGAGQRITNAYTHGRGSWSSGHGGGTICQQETIAGTKSTVVLVVAGPARLSTNVTRLGHLGVALRLSFTVSASDDMACPMGTTGSLTLFASYQGVHKDSAKLAFAVECTSHNGAFTGGMLHVLIAHDGHQVK